MPKLVQKSGYVRAVKASGYMKYIATREGVEKLEANRSSEPEAANAQDPEVYMRYIATRPRAERHGDHGLFSSAESVELGAAMEELNGHEGNVWTIIYSLRREDAARLGFDNAAAWRDLLMAHQPDLADAMKIPADLLHWYAAFHDEGEHPHIHMMVWSDDPKRGFLTRRGIELMRSKLTNAIFRDELLNLYQRKDVSYKDLTYAAQDAMKKLIDEMRSGLCDSPDVALKMSELASKLESVKGKKQYGYLKKSLKEKVDAIVDELAKVPAVAQCYEVWNKLRDELESYYHEKTRERLPLSQQKEFRSIKNMVIREAENIRLGEHTFEDEGMEDEPDAGSASDRSYLGCKEILLNWDSQPEDKRMAVRMLERLWEERQMPEAARLLGCLYRDGIHLYEDWEKAELWLTRAAEMNDAPAMCSLAKLMSFQRRMDEAAVWLERSAALGNQYAQYQLGKLCLLGSGVPKDADRAVEYLTDAAEQGSPFAQYLLGKLYLDGKDVPRDDETAQYWLGRSADQGNQYARFLLEQSQAHPNLLSDVLLSATRLLHHMGGIFQQNSAPPANPVGLRADRKLRQRIREKKMAMGHKPDDHEEYQGPTMSM